MKQMHTKLYIGLFTGVLIISAGCFYEPTPEAVDIVPEYEKPAVVEEALPDEETGDLELDAELDAFLDETDAFIRELDAVELTGTEIEAPAENDGTAPIKDSAVLPDEETTEGETDLDSIEAELDALERELEALDVPG